MGNKIIYFIIFEKFFIFIILFINYSTKVKLNTICAYIQKLISKTQNL